MSSFRDTGIAAAVGKFVSSVSEIGFWESAQSGIGKGTAFVAETGESDKMVRSIQ